MGCDVANTVVCCERMRWQMRKRKGGVKGGERGL